MGKLGRRSKGRFSVMKAIRYKCLDCCCGNAAEVRRCEIRECSLWEFRFGGNPTLGMAREAQAVPAHGRDEKLWESKKSVVMK